jgi:allantoin racemase
VTHVLKYMSDKKLPANNMKLLVINPNTGQATTERLQHFIGQSLPSGVRFSCITAKFCFPYIASEESYAVATHAVLETWKAYQEQCVPGELPDRILLGCFGDPGLYAMREVCSQPVRALAEASFEEAAALGGFAIVTGGERWKPMAMGLGYGATLTSIETVSQTGVELLANPTMAIEVLSEACQKAATSGVKSIILGGAGLAGYAKQVQPFVNVPVIDSVEAGVRRSINAVAP